MKNSYILIILVVLFVALGLLFAFKDKKVEEPNVMEVNVSNVSNEESVAGETSQTQNDEPLIGEIDTNIITENTSQAVKEFTVEGKNFSFSPSTLKVQKGDKVKITFVNSEGFHDFKIDEFGSATKQIKAPATEVLEFTADKIGSFEYYCSVGSHRAMGMKGVLIVE